MMRERRDKLPPVPENFAQHLNDAQLSTLRQIENFGYQLKFIRRPLFQAPTVVVENAEHNRYAVLDEQGELDLQHGMSLRP